MPNIANTKSGKGYASSVYMKKKMETSFYNVKSPTSPVAMKRLSVPPMAGSEFNRNTRNRQTALLTQDNEVFTKPYSMLTERQRQSVSPTRSNERIPNSRVQSPHELLSPLSPMLSPNNQRRLVH